MERKINDFFLKWKTDIIRKPMILYGAKQIGKTFYAERRIMRKKKNKSF